MINFATMAQPLTMLENLILLLMAAFPLMGSPGPATLSLAAVGAAFGRDAGLKYLLGIIVGTFGVLVLIATGVTGLILAIPALKSLITLLAGGYILYLAWKIATSAPLSVNDSKARLPSFPGGFVLAIANPKAFAAIGAVYTGSTVAQNGVILDVMIKMAVLSAVIVVVNAAWLYFGSVVSSVLHDPRKGRMVNVMFAVLLVASVGFALL